MKAARLPQRVPASLALAVAALALGACGADDEPEQTTPTPVGADPTAPATTERPPADTAGTETTPDQPERREPEEERTRTTTVGEAGPGGAGDEIPARVPVVITFRAGGPTPRRLRIPAFLALELTGVSQDRRPHTLVLFADRRYRVAVPPGGQASTSVPGLKPGRYSISADGRRSAVRLEVGGEPGP